MKSPQEWAEYYFDTNGITVEDLVVAIQKEAVHDDAYVSKLLLMIAKLIMRRDVPMDHLTEAEQLLKDYAASPAQQQPKKSPHAPILSDEAFAFINENTEAIPDSDSVSFEGDWGNWNWLWSEIYKRCVK